MFEEAGLLAGQSSQKNLPAFKNFIGLWRGLEKEELRVVPKYEVTAYLRRGTVDRYRPQGFSESLRLGPNEILNALPGIFSLLLAALSKISLVPMIAEVKQRPGKFT